MADRADRLQGAAVRGPLEIVGDILVGTASWTDKTLLESGWYPPSADTPQARLEYYASQFPLVEVDSTYYAPPNERTVALWEQRTPPWFTFNIKAFSLLTGHPTKPSALPKDLRPEDGGKNLYPKDLPAQSYEDVWTRFLSALDPLVGAGKLGLILFQFPPWFTIRRANKQYLLEVAARCRPLRVAVEFRHASWFAGDNRAETLDFLTEHELPFVCVDMPQGHRSSIPPVLAATSAWPSCVSTATATSGPAPTSTTSSVTCTATPSWSSGCRSCRTWPPGPGRPTCS